MNRARNLADIGKILGASAVLTEPETIAPYLTDWRGRFVGRALCVTLPRSVDELVALVRYCNEQRLPMVPQGGNTSLCGAATPDNSGTTVLISLARLNKIREIDQANRSMTAESGCILADIQQAAADVGCLFPLSLASSGSCQLGGNISTNAGGIHVLRYGNTRQLTLGLEVVLPSGELWQGLNKLRKNNSGYDLKHCFIGAEGTLGIITAAVIKLFPRPRDYLTVQLDVVSVDAAISVLNELNACANPLEVFELMSQEAVALVAAKFPDMAIPPLATPWRVLCEFSLEEAQTAQSAEAAKTAETAQYDEHSPAFACLAAAEQGGLIRACYIARSEQQRQNFWHCRELISEAQKRQGLSIKHDISLPISQIPPFLAECNAALRHAYADIEIITFGHLGDGSLHYNMRFAAGDGALHRAESTVNRMVHDRVIAYGGSISAEHGIGQLKIHCLQDYKSPIELNLMRSLKQALDPHNLMNPGKILA